MSDDIQIYRFHVEPEAGLVAVEFRLRNPDTGAFEPPKGYVRHTMPVSEEVIAHLKSDILPFLTRDLADVPNVRSHALTSELHQLREARKERDEAQRAAFEATQEARRAAAEREKHESAVAVLRAEAARLQGG